MIYKTIWIFIISIIIVFIISCDLEKLSGYDYAYNPPPESAVFTGTVYHRFTFDPIPLVEVNIANQATYTDTNGQYFLYYHFGEDDQRNQPIDISISAENYQKVDTSIVVFPENELNVYLHYASPIIQKIALVDSTILQAIVFDYQGFNDIAMVFAQNAYRRPGEKFPSLYVETKLIRVDSDSLNTSLYQARIAESILEYGYIIADEYSMRAQDRRNFQDFLTSLEGGTDTLLSLPKKMR